MEASYITYRKKHQPEYDSYMGSAKAYTIVAALGVIAGVGAMLAGLAVHLTLGSQAPHKLAAWLINGGAVVGVGTGFTGAFGILNEGTNAGRLARQLYIDAAKEHKLTTESAEPEIKGFEGQVRLKIVNDGFIKLEVWKTFPESCCRAEHDKMIHSFITSDKELVV